MKLKRKHVIGLLLVAAFWVGVLYLGVTSYRYQKESKPTWTPRPGQATVEYGTIVYVQAQTGVPTWTPGFSDEQKSGTRVQQAINPPTATATAIPIAKPPTNTPVYGPATIAFIERNNELAAQGQSTIPPGPNNATLAVTIKAGTDNPATITPTPTASLSPTVRPTTASEAQKMLDDANKILGTLQVPTLPSSLASYDYIHQRNVMLTVQAVLYTATPTRVR